MDTLNSWFGRPCFSRSEVLSVGPRKPSSRMEGNQSRGCGVPRPSPAAAQPPRPQISAAGKKKGNRHLEINTRGQIRENQQGQDCEDLQDIWMVGEILLLQKSKGQLREIYEKQWEDEEQRFFPYCVWFFSGLIPEMPEHNAGERIKTKTI